MLYRSYYKALFNTYDGFVLGLDEPHYECINGSNFDHFALGYPNCVGWNHSMPQFMLYKPSW